MTDYLENCIRPIRRGTPLQIAAQALAYIANDLRQGNIDEACRTAEAALSAIDFDAILRSMRESPCQTITPASTAAEPSPADAETQSSAITTAESACTDTAIT